MLEEKEIRKLMEIDHRLLVGDPHDNYAAKFSKLNKYRTNIFQLHEAGMSICAISRYLNRKRDFSISRSSVSRYLKKYHG